MNAMQRVFLGLLLAILLAACDEAETAMPQRKDITEAVFASGELYQSEEYLVTANADGFLQWMGMAEGDTVAVGDLLARLEADVPGINLAIAQANYNDAAARTMTSSPEIQQLSVQLEQAKLQVKNDEASYRRYEALVATNTVSKQDFENARLKLEASKAQVQVLEKSLLQLRDAAALAAKNAKSQLKIQQENTGEYRVVAKIGGQVLKLYKKQGELVRKGEGIALIAGGEHLIRLYVSEEDIAAVKAGQAAGVVLNSEPQRTYQAVIRQVLPLFDAKNQSFVAIAEFAERPEGHLIAGTQLQANILLGSRSKVLVIPAACLIKNNKVVLKNGKEITVQAGRQNGEWVEILSGLDGSSALIVHKKKKVK